MKEIARLVGGSRSSVSLWVRDIRLSDEQIEMLCLQHRRGSVLGGEARAERTRTRRRQYQAEGRRRARDENAGYVAGCMLFWAEDSRRRNGVEFTNSDPQMIRVFTEFLRTYFGVSADKLRITCNLFADHEERQLQIEDFWLVLLELPRSSLRRTVINRYSRYSKKKRTNKLPYGTCRLTVHSTEISQILHGSIQELGGFDRPEWLDL